MRIKIQSGKDFGAGLMLALFGAVAVVVSAGHPLGTARNMGPGYFPMLVGGCLAVLGTILMLRALWVTGEPVSLPASFRPLALLLGAVVAFAFLVDTVGLLPAIVALVIVSALGGRQFEVGETIWLALALSVMAIGIFVYGLGLSYRILILP